MLVMSDCDSFVEYNFRSRSLLPPRRFGSTVGIVRKKARERIGSEEGVEARVSCDFTGRQVSHFANESITFWGYLRISVTPRMTYQRDH